MTVYGKMITCERCKKSVFVKQEGENVLDGGYTRLPKYEQIPGWISEYVGERNIKSDLCPDCGELFHIIQKRHKAEWVGFMEDNKNV